MKFQITFKCPDVRDQLPGAHDDGYDPEDEENETDAIEYIFSKFVEHGKYITVEFDTNTGTACAVPVGNR